MKVVKNIKPKRLGVKTRNLLTFLVAPLPNGN